LFLLLLLKKKNHGLDLKDIIENYKNIDKNAKKKNKKSKEEGPN
jgi:hypothetical protein